jgi:hypothetical protein
MGKYSKFTKIECYKNVTEKKYTILLEEKDKIIEKQNKEIKELQDALKNKEIKELKNKQPEKGYAFEDKFIDITNLCDISRKEFIQNLSPTELINISNWISPSQNTVDKNIKSYNQHRLLDYARKNVIYILTTADIKKERKYIIGKAKNLSNILDYEVIYHQECLDEENMNISKIIIFNKLKKYREHIDKEIFILPKERDIEYFKDLIKKVIEFVKIKSNLNSKKE